jgi:hypothetical protein
LENVPSTGTSIFHHKIRHAQTSETETENNQQDNGGVMKLRFFNFYHQSGYPKQPWKIEYWKADWRYRAMLHIHWNGIHKGHWLCIFMPDMPWGSKLPPPEFTDDNNATSESNQT